FQIKNELSQFDELKEKRSQQEIKKDIEIHTKIAENNFNKFQVGDKINVLLPLEMNGNVKSVYYYTNYSEDNFKDTLFITGILVKKNMESNNQFELSHNEYFFTLKILQMKNKDSSLVERKYSRGNT